MNSTSQSEFQTCIRNGIAARISAIRCTILAAVLCYVGHFGPGRSNVSKAPYEFVA